MKPILFCFLFISIILSKTNAQCWSINDSTYTMGFETADMAKFANWTIVDSDANDTTWSITKLSSNTGDSSAVIKTYGNDWLFSSCMQLSADTSYEISFMYRRAYPYFKDQGILLTIGSAATVIAISDTLINIDSIKIDDYQKTHILYTPQTSGTQVFGLYAYGTSDYDYTRMYVDDFKINKYICDTISIALGNDTAFSFCRNDSLKLSVNTGFATYQWSNNASTTDSLWVKQAGTYAVQITHSNGCIGKDTIVVTVDSLTIEDITVSANQLIKCIGDSVSLNALTSCTSFVWMDSSNAVIGNTSQQWVSDIGTYYLTAIDSTACYGKDSISIINATNSVSISTFKNTFCSNDSLKLNATVGFTSYNWNGDDSLSQSSQLYVKTADTYFVMAKDNNNCIWSDTIVIADTAIIQSPHDTIQLDKSKICLNDSALIQAYIVNDLHTKYNFQWTYSYGTINNIYSDTAIYAKTQGSYAVVITDTSTGCISYRTVTLNVVKPYSKQNICIVTVDSVTGKNSIAWEKQNNLGIEAFKLYRENSQGAFESFATIDFDSTSMYTDTLANPQVRSYKYNITSIDTCGNESSLVTANIHSTIHLAISLGVGGRYNLAWTPYVGLDFDTYKIYRDTSVNQNHPVLLDSVSTSVLSYTDINAINGVDNYYYIKIISTNSCSASKKKGNSKFAVSQSNKVNPKLLSIEERNMNVQKIQISPNPFTNQANITYTLEKESSTIITIYDILGNKVIEENQMQQAGNYNYIINEQQVLQVGVYFIEVNINGQTFKNKIIKM